MKKLFIPLTCFLLLFSQNTLSVSEGIQNISSDLDIEKIENDDSTQKPDLIKSEKKNGSLEKQGVEIEENLDKNNLGTLNNIPSDDSVSDTEEKSANNKKANNLDKAPIQTKNPTSPCRKIQINEIFANPDGSDSGKEFVELYNNCDTDVSLKNWCLHDKNDKCYIFSDIEIKSHDFLTFYNKSDFSFSLNNSNEKISLKDEDDNTVSEHSYATTSSGLSWNYDNTWYEESPTPNDKNNENPLTKDYPKIYINELLPNPIDNENDEEFIEIYNPTDEIILLKNWVLRDGSKTGLYTFENDSIEPNSYLVIYRSEFGFALNNSGDETISLIAPNSNVISSMSYIGSREGLSLNRSDDWYWTDATPGMKNNPDPRILNYPPLTLNEILPNPSGDESVNEFIEIYNPNNEKVSLKNWTLKDGSKTGSYVFMSDIYIEPKSYFVIYRKDFGFALNNSDENISLIAPNEEIISEVSYKESAKEDVSYNYHHAEKKWRWSKHLTPGKVNIFNNLPEITEFEISDAYKDVYTEFEAEASDPDNEKLKVRWDFGDGRRSYKWKTSHKYLETGTYHGSLRIQDESEEIIKNFTVYVKKYPKYEVNIIKIVPNPSGKDTGNEYIIIKNKEKKKIDLKNWSIATGTKKKKLVNHPIYDELIIKSEKTEKITKKYSAISLPNKKGSIEIRRPDGSVADKLNYGDKDVSIPDNASYEKIDGAWQWIIPVDPKKMAEINSIVTQAVKNENMFSQNRLERIAAYNAIYNPSKKLENKFIEKPKFFTLLLQKINHFMSKGFHIAKNIIKNPLNKQGANLTAQIYKIPQTTTPCTQTPLSLDKTFNFCK